MTKRRTTYDIIDIPTTVVLGSEYSKAVLIDYLSYEAAVVIWSDATDGVIQVQISTDPSDDNSWDVLGSWAAGVSPQAFIVPNYAKAVRLACTKAIVAGPGPFLNATASGMFEKDS